MTPADLRDLLNDESLVLRYPNGTTALPMPERFWSKVDRSGGPDTCWPWLAFKLPRGYGRFHVSGREPMVAAHRFSYLLNVGPIPDGLFVLHKCDNPPCVNPAHLWLGTHDDNARDRVSKGRSASMPGEKNPSAHLTLEQVQEIRRRYRGGVYGLRSQLAREFGVEPQTVWSIVTNRSWR